MLLVNTFVTEGKKKQILHYITRTSSFSIWFYFSWHYILKSGTNEFFMYILLFHFKVGYKIVDKLVAFSSILSFFWPSFSSVSCPHLPAPCPSYTPLMPIKFPLLIFNSKMLKTYFLGYFDPILSILGYTYYFTVCTLSIKIKKF